MYSTVGNPRRVTDAQIEIILAWNRNRRTISDWARSFGVSTGTIYSALMTWSSAREWESAHRGRAKRGRRRMLSAAQVETLFSWYRTRKTRVQLTRELGLSGNTIREVVKRDGQYKRGTAEQHDVHREARREKLRNFELAAGQGRSRDNQNPYVQLRAENAARFRAYLGIDKA